MTRRVTRLRDDWKFTRTAQQDALASQCDESGWETVQVPHDWAIAGPFDREHDIERKVNKNQADIEENVRYITGRTGGLPHTGEGWYRKAIEIPDSKKGRVFRLECDGIMSHSKICCNGDYVGGWPYGYTSFALDLTPFIKAGETNVIAVHVNNIEKSSRWYPGAGIYRNVHLLDLAPTHIGYWGVYITTPTLTDDEGVASIRTTIENGGEQQSVTLKTTILDPSGVEVAQVESKQDIAGSAEFEQSLTVPSPHRWSLEDPAQYRAVSEVIVDGEQVDCLETRFGFRTLRFDVNTGFYLNDKHVKMNGVCQHHDLGPLGAAVNREALKRQMTILKEMGCNAIRTSHNPPDPQLPELASEMGMLVIDEMFDEWKHVKMKNGYNTLWDEWAEKDVRALIKRDRNHPAVIMWSTGNELPEQRKEDGPEISRFLADICHDEDPTRPVTAGLNHFGTDISRDLAAALDIPGWNYRPHTYGHARAALPDKPTYGSETASTISSRGEYYFPAIDEIHTKRDSLQVNSYDLCYAGWATSPDIEFQAQDAHPFVMGEFVWTGFDYLGEPTPYNEEWPSRSSYFGILDLGGLPKDRFYLYQSQWSDKEVLHLLPHWTWPGHEGKPIPVHCYTSFNRVELFVNGKSMGEKSHYHKHKVLESNYRFVWNEVPYEPGELKVVAYNKDGVAAEHTVVTAEEPAALELLADRSEIKPDGDDMAFVTVKVVDKNGVLCPSADNSISYEVDGPVEIVGLCNGDATSLASFKGTQMKVFNGMAVVYLRSVDGGSGEITLKATTDDLPAASVHLETKK